MVIQLTTNYWLVLFYAFILLCFMHYLLLAFTFHAIFIFAHLSIYFLVIFTLLTWAFLFFFFLRYLITNLNPKKLLMVLGRFGYYPLHYGTWDFFLDLGLETLAYLGDLVILSDYSVWSSWGLPQDIGLAVCFCM